MPTEQALCEQAQTKRDERSSQKIKRLQAFTLEVDTSLGGCFHTGYIQNCQKQLAFMQEYHKILCDRMRALMQFFGEDLVKTIGEIYQRKA